MQIDDLKQSSLPARFDADLAIIGGGPAGLTIARELFGHRTRVLVLESGGMAEEPGGSLLNAVEIADGAPIAPHQASCQSRQSISLPRQTLQKRAT